MLCKRICTRSYIQQCRTLLSEIRDNTHPASIDTSKNLQAQQIKSLNKRKQFQLEQATKIAEKKQKADEDKEKRQKEQAERQLKSDSRQEKQEKRDEANNIIMHSMFETQKQSAGILGEMAQGIKQHANTFEQLANAMTQSIQMQMMQMQYQFNNNNRINNNNNNNNNINNNNQNNNNNNNQYN
jgi:hypothetical protein